MRVIPGGKQFDGSITATTMSLNDAMLLRPEISNKVVELFKNKCSLTAFLQSRGKTRKDVSNTDTFKIDNVYGNPKVMWPLIGYPEKVVHQTRAVTVGGSTPSNGTQVGLGQTEFEIYIDDPYFNPGDIVTLEERFKQIYIKTEAFPIAPGEWRYTAVINGKNLTNFILYDASVSTGKLLAAGHEMGRMSTKFREMSLTGYESHNYPEWYSNRMTIQRIKASISGSAFKSKMWIEHNGKMMYWNLQEYKLMDKAHMFRENDIIYGMATTDVDDVNFVFDEDGKPVQSGDGIIEQIDGSLRRNYTLEPDGTMDISYIDDLLQDCKLMAGTDGVLEVVMAGGQAATGAFERTMRNIYKYEPSMITKKLANGDLEVGADFVAYYHNGVRMIPLQVSAFDAPNLPSTYNSLTGRKNESYRMMVLNTGLTDGGQNNIELITLGNGEGNRAFTKKYINGMEGNTVTDVASTSLDGLAIQVLMESGVLVRNPFTCGMLELFDSRA